MNGIGILLLRGGSKSLQLKNIQMLNSRPLAYYTIDFMLSDSRIKKLVISSDNDLILDVVSKYPSKDIILHHRSSENSSDNSSSEDALVEVIQFYDNNYSADNYDFVLYAQATEPLRPKGLLSRAIDIYRSKKVDSVFAAFLYHKNFWTIDKDNNFQLITSSEQSHLPRQIKRPVFREDTGICLISSPTVIRSGRRIGDKVEILPYEHLGALIDIHTHKDLLMAEYIMNYQNYD